MLDIQGAAEYLGTSVRHVRRLITDRKITYVKVGGLVRFRKADLENYISRNTVSAVKL